MAVFKTGEGGPPKILSFSYMMPVYGTVFVVCCTQNTGADAPQGKEHTAMYEIEFVRGHVEVFLDGAFCFSADTRGEAEAEIALMTA